MSNAHSLPAQETKRTPWLVRNNYRIRAISFFLVFFGLGMTLWKTAIGPLPWVLLALQFLVYPHALYVWTKRRPDPQKTELNNLFLDAFLIGIWIAALHFPVWPSFTLALASSLNVRASDVACRYGGEEFLVLLPNLTPEIATQRAEQWRASFAAATTESANGEIKATLSIGVAFFPDDGASLAELTRCADVALYRAKAEGRNRVVLCRSRSSTAPIATFADSHSNIGLANQK